MNIKVSIGTSTLLFFTAIAATGQPLPSTQPKLLTIYCEKIKVGHAAAHLKTESAWTAAFAKAQSTNHYLAMASVTGPPEVWFVQPWESYTAWGNAMERDQANKRLAADMERAAARDAAHVDDLRILEARALPELSHGAFPDLSRDRYWQISLVRIKPGHFEDFAAAAKAYKAAVDRAGSPAKWRTYLISGGMPGLACLLFSSVETFGEFDAMVADDEVIRKALSPEEQEVTRKFGTDALASWESNRYQLDPQMSFVSEEVKATDPAFWSRKR